MNSSIFSKKKAIEISKGVYRSSEPKLFSMPPEIVWDDVKTECNVLLADFESNPGPQRAKRWLMELGYEISDAKTKADLKNAVDQLAERIRPNSIDAVRAVRIMIALWKAGAILFPPDSITKNDTLLARFTANFGPKTYMDQFESTKGKLGRAITTMKFNSKISEVVLGRILTRSTKSLLTVGPISSISNISPTVRDALLSDSGDKRGKKFTYIGLFYFNEPNADYNKVCAGMKRELDMKNLKPEDLKRSNTKCLWVTHQDPTLEEWRAAVAEHLDEKRQLKNLGSHLSAFQHLFKYLLEHPSSPRQILMFLHRNYKPEVTLVEYIMELNIGISVKGSYLAKIKDFFDWFLDTFCSEPSEEDDTPIRLIEFKNPIDASDIPGQAARPGQTHRLAMPYAYVETCIDIITRNDFAWAKTIEADYFLKIDEITGERIRVWSPVRAYALLLKFMLPLRTHQVRLLESGEGDLQRYDQASGQWQPNNLDTETKKSPTGFIKQIWNGDRGGYMTGLYINTNKTKTRDAVDEGYSIPWQNEDVINLANRLENWQIENNPLSKPTPFRKILPALDSKPTKDVIALTPDRFYLFRDPAGSNPEAPPTPGRMRVIFLKLMAELEDELSRKNIKNSDGSRITIVTRMSEDGRATKAIFDLHSLRVSGLTSFVKAGVPIHILSKLLAGHSSFLMTLYYAKMDIGYVTDILNEAQLKISDNAGRELANAIKSMEMNELRRFTASNHISGLTSLAASESGLWSWMDWGICPVNTQGCNEGGEPVIDHADRNYFAPVKGGPGNCPLCRFFITGPQFLFGLVAKFNEIALIMSEQSKRLREKRDQRQKLLAERIYYVKRSLDFPKESALARATSVFETLREDVNTTAETLHAIYRLIEQSKDIVKRQSTHDSENNLPLIKSPKYDVSFKEAGEWETLDEVCRSAQFFESVNWRNANLRRSNVFNAMLQRNGMSPVFIGLSDEDSKAALDSLSMMMIKRLGRENTRRLMEGEAALDELGVREEVKLAIAESAGHAIDLIEHSMQSETISVSPVSARRTRNGS